MDQISSDIQKLSLDAIEESQTDAHAWHSLIQNLSELDLEKLKSIFNSQRDDEGKEVGLNKTQFLDAICLLYDSSEYSVQSFMLFESITKHEKSTAKWDEFLDFLVENMYPSAHRNLTLAVSSIEVVAHGKNESVAKIVLIETKIYFCYAIVLKHGKVGLYDGNLNFLTSYHSILTREDISRPEDERRRRNRWVTDAIFCPDILMLMIVSSARSLIIYEASGLRHVPYWLILSTPNMVQCMSYKPYKTSEHGQSILFCGDDSGEVTAFTFFQPKNDLLKRKRSDDVTIYYWEDFLKQKNHVEVHQYKKVHQNGVKNIQYYPALDSLVTCSRYAQSSVIIKHVSNKRKSSIFKMNRGASSFALSTTHKILITGSDDGTIRLWNPVLSSKPIAVLCEHQCDVVDIEILENQELFLSCSRDGILKLWDLKEQCCLQTIRLKFPAFSVEGKLVEWGNKCIYPGPKRNSPNYREVKNHDLTSCFGIQDVTEMRTGEELESARNKPKIDVWERSNLLIACCNYVAKLRMDFNDPRIQHSFCCPILPPPPLQSSVLIPCDWRFEAEMDEKFEKSDQNVHSFRMRKRVEDLKFILDKDLFEETGTKSNINYKIAILESKKSKMMEKVSQGAPYLALDVNDITELKIAEHIPRPKRKKNEHILLKIKSLLDDASSRNQIFSEPSTSSRTRSSSRSSIVEFPL